MKRTIYFILAFLFIASTLLLTTGCGKQIAKDPNRPMLSNVKIGTMPGKTKQELNEGTKITNETLEFNPNDEILIEATGNNLKTGMTIDAGIYENGEEVMQSQQIIDADISNKNFIFLLGYEEPMPAGVYPLEVKIISPDGVDNDDMYVMKMITIK